MVTTKMVKTKMVKTKMVKTKMVKTKMLKTLMAIDWVQVLSDWVQVLSDWVQGLMIGPRCLVIDQYFCPLWHSIVSYISNDLSSLNVRSNICWFCCYILYKSRSVLYNMSEKKYHHIIDITKIHKILIHMR